MTPETRKTLLGLISEYGDSLTRIQAEKELMRLMEQRALTECAVPIKAFKTLATAYWRDTVPVVRDELEAQLDLLDMVRAASLTTVKIVTGTAA